MSLPFKRRSTRPIPDGAKLTTRRGKQTARWIDGAESYTAPIIGVASGKHRGDRRVLIQSRAYYTEYRDGDGRCRRIALGTDFDAAKSKLDKLVKRGERERAGVDCASERREREPIDQHMEAFIHTLKTTGNQTRKHGRRVRKPVTADHAKAVETHIRRIVNGCGVSRLVDVSASKVDAYMLTLAASLGPATLNKHLTNVRAFVTWAVESKLLMTDGLAGVHYFDENDVESRGRAALSRDEAQQLIDAALRRPVELARFYVGPKDDRTTDEDRRRIGFRNALAWETIIYTGLRANELRNVRWADIDLDGGWMTVRAETCKTGVRRDVALRADHVANLRRWRDMCGDVDPEATAIRLRNRTAQALQSDLKLAGIAYRDHEGRYRDVHALRYTCNTWLRDAGVPDFIIKRHMGHSTSGDMTETYTDARLIDMHSAVEKLPALTIQAAASRKGRVAG